MNKGKSRTLVRVPKFHRGDHVIFDFGMRPVTGEVIEDRGTIGVGGRRLFSVRFPFDEGIDTIIELPEEELEMA